MKNLWLLCTICFLCGCSTSRKQTSHHIFVQKGCVDYHIPSIQKPFKILFLADTHFTIEDERGKPYYKYSKRMGGDAVEPAHYGISNGKEQELQKALERARKASADLVVLGGDIINFPSAASAEYLKKLLDESQLPWVYVAGNHDWHYEGEPGTANEHRNRWENTTLKPLFQGQNPLYHARTINGINLLFIDNSTYEILDEQLIFLKKELKKKLPTVLFMHIPLYYPHHGIGYGCGSPFWNRSTDTYYQIEQREPWPEKGHTSTTFEFRNLVVNSPNVIGVFTGHIHHEGVDYYRNQIQYVVEGNKTGHSVLIQFNSPSHITE